MTRILVLAERICKMMNQVRQLNTSTAFNLHIASKRAHGCLFWGLTSSAWVKILQYFCVYCYFVKKQNSPVISGHVRVCKRKKCLVEQLVHWLENTHRDTQPGVKRCTASLLTYFPQFMSPKTSCLQLFFLSFFFLYRKSSLKIPLFYSLCHKQASTYVLS